MMSTMRAVVRDGKVELLEPMDAPEGTEALVTLLAETSRNAFGQEVSADAFWQAAAMPAIAAVWDNTEDDIYAELLAG